MIPDCGPGHGGDTCPQYSTEYVTKREMQEKEWADNNFEDLEVRQALTPPPEISERRMAPEFTSSNPRCSAILSSDAHTTNTWLHSSDSASPATHSETSNQTPESETCLKSISCPHEGCAKIYQGSDAHINLRRHVRCIHERKEWSCPNCGLRTGRRDNLRQHFIKKHPETSMPEWLMVKGRSACRADSQDGPCG